MNITNELWASARQAFYAGTLFLLAAALAFFCFFVIVLTVFRFVDPPTSAVMLRDHFAGARVRHEWTPIENISPNLVRAVISSEDARFCSHYGVDLHEWKEVMRTVDRDGIGAVRGASTITMQVAKNLFLWTDRSLLRKGLELAITPIIELAWPKRRIIEVYLNIAQWGPGLFGVGVAARHHFNREPIDLTPTEAALLTASLPAPSVRRPGAATRYTRRIANRIKVRMRPDNVRTDCVFGDRDDK
ncbi:MAG: monofunctional biosynthetic peptidoglycan transglycosylase [Alphaproteobacteria bacterium]|nr:monofunctional biosynthetic peptidoglycan transglycosylase [Alphaproteobacteria bacterium]